MTDIHKLIKNEIGSYERLVWSGEIGGENVTLYSKPLTPSDIAYVRKWHPDFTTQPSPSGMVELIIRKAELDDGTKPFSRGRDKPILERFTNRLIGEIFGALFADQFDEETDEQFEDRVKN